MSLTEAVSISCPPRLSSLYNNTAPTLLPRGSHSIFVCFELKTPKLAISKGGGFALKFGGGGTAKG